ncbi:hypothetical protein FRC01_014296, partial [Tulasnella sp. 417]
HPTCLLIHRRKETRLGIASKRLESISRLLSLVMGRLRSWEGRWPPRWSLSVTRKARRRAAGIRSGLF